jgi:hypothetical protein
MYFYLVWLYRLKSKDLGNLKCSIEVYTKKQYLVINEFFKEINFLGNNYSKLSKNDFFFSLKPVNLNNNLYINMGNKLNKDKIIFNNSSIYEFNIILSNFIHNNKMVFYYELLSRNLLKS